MPQIGEIKKGSEIGHKTKDNKYIWLPCNLCGKERWVRLSHQKPRSQCCPKCSNRQSLQRVKHRSYILIKLAPEDFFSSMAMQDNYVREHRLIMAKHLGRCLHPWEIVHHKNHIRDDNRIENLQLVSDHRHKQISILETKIEHLEKRVAILEAENAKLNLQLRQELPNA